MNADLFKRSFLAVTMGLAMTIPMVAFAEQPAAAPVQAKIEQHGEDHGPGMFEKKLGLTQAQIQQIHTIRDQAKEQAQALKKSLWEKHTAFKTYMFSANSNEAKALEMQKDMEQVHEQLSELRLHTMFKIRSLMTPEQLQKLTAMHEQWDKNFHSGACGEHHGSCPTAHGRHGYGHHHHPFSHAE